jgi:hypothetical protein
MKNDKYSGKSRDEKLDMALEDRDKILRIEDELGKFAKITAYNIINIDGCDLLMSCF